MSPGDVKCPVSAMASRSRALNVRSQPPGEVSVTSAPALRTSASSLEARATAE